MTNRLLDPFGNPIVPSLDALRPLTFVVDDTVRGNVAPSLLSAPIKGEVSLVGPLINTRSRTSRGELLSAVLAIQVVPANGTTEEEALDEFVDYSVEAEIVWGLGAIEFTAHCDWQNGTQISLTAETLRVRAKYVKRCATWEKPADKCPPSFLVSAGVGYGDSGASSNPVRLTKLAQVETPGDSVDIPIPAFAQSWTMQLVSGSTSAEVRVGGRGARYDVPYTITGPLTNVAQHNEENAFPIRNGARFLRVKNMNQTDPLAAWIVFGLKL